MEDPSLVEGGDEPVVRLVRWTEDVPGADADAAYRHAVAGSALVDPLATLRTAARALDLPVGALVRHVLAEWASAGSSALLEVGPSAVERLVEAARDVERADRADDREAAVQALLGQVRWLAAGVEDPVGTYPEGGAGRRRRRRVGAYGLALGPGGVLLVRVADGYPGAGRWTLPGGGVEHGEDPLDGLVREFHEETGLRAQVLEFLLSDSHHLVDDARGDDLHLLRLVWRVQVDGEEVPRVVEEDGSTAEVRWVGTRELPRVPLLSVASRALESAGLSAPPPDRRDGAV